MYTEEDVEEFLRQAQRLPPETTTLNRPRFNSSMQSPSTMSKDQIMARAWQRIIKLEYCVAQSNFEYDMYSMNS